jgi:hypothetical protein
MEEIKKEDQQPKVYGSNCNCLWCAGSSHHRFGPGLFLMSILVGLLAFLVVFWLGVKVGEVKTYMRYGQERGPVFYGQTGRMGMPFMQSGMTTVPKIIPSPMQYQATTTPNK